MTEDPPDSSEDELAMSRAEAFRQLHRSINSGEAAISIEETPIGRKVAFDIKGLPPDPVVERARSQTNITDLVKAVDSGDIDSSELSVPKSTHQEFAEICATVIDDVTVADVLEQL